MGSTGFRGTEALAATRVWRNRPSHVAKLVEVVDPSRWHSASRIQPHRLGISLVLECDASVGTPRSRWPCAMLARSRSIDDAGLPRDVSNRDAIQSSLIVVECYLFSSGPWPTLQFDHPLRCWDNDQSFWFAPRGSRYELRPARAALRFESCEFG